MKRNLLTAALVFALAAHAQLKPPALKLKVGDMAPDFSLRSTTGQEVRLSDFRGKRNVVLAFFPAAFTGGCTKEVNGYQAGIQKFANMDTEVFAISTDNLPTLRHWAEEQKLSYPLLSDFMRNVSAQYGVLIPEAGLAYRTTFVIDKEGRIRHIEQGNSAIDPTGAELACSRLR
ncbi:MAG TPA: redoxin domain-containing protein [Bryobacteraceae bacterium]|nr:redoxin domain-containing protein [Bryobacteraceae bacterium]HOL73500.1 redoxin domain-containing protein [Bryobacteraceae bacterium]HOQ47443.1 redoxin domain-containing protein [Bryobacteraceae bacterium]HPQ15677.1 redoxin domain-containing protein [Bryobacteraceae bacterium]HPU74048.1 redoxin domain-containing protein [Bryobacteraceae bacterium]